MCAGPASQETAKPENRQGPLWDCYRRFTAQGYEIDTKSYSTCFRLQAKPDGDLQAALDSLPQGVQAVV